MLIFILPSVKLRTKLTKVRVIFYLMNKTAESKTIFKFLYAYLLVRSVYPNPAILSVQTMALSNRVLARYNITRVDLETFKS